MPEGERGSPRARLALLAREAALAVEGVASVGPRLRPDRATYAGGERIDGVVCAAESGERYGVAVYLGAEPVQLQELAERVRAEVTAAAERSGLGDDLGSVDVVVDDLVEGGPLR